MKRCTHNLRVRLPGRARERCRGLTLIEVVAGLALLGTLLVAILIAKQRYTRQWVLAGRKLEATAAADRLLSQWWQDPAKLPREGRGDLDSQPGRAALTWRTRRLESPRAEALDAEVVRLEVFGSPEESRLNAEPLVIVDLLLAKPEPGDAL